MLELVPVIKEEIVRRLHQSKTQYLAKPREWPFKGADQEGDYPLENDFCNNLAKLLVEHKVCDYIEDGLMVIIPAFIAYGIDIPMPPSSASV